MRHVQARRPDLPRVMVSARIDDAMAADLIAADVIHVFLAKPWGRNAVLNATRIWTKLQGYTANRSAAALRSVPHLRAYPRYPLMLSVWVRWAALSNPVELVTRDISRGGAFLATPLPPLKGDRLDIELRGSDSSRAWQLTGRVAHVVSTQRASVEGVACGFGVEFTGIDEQRSALDAIVAAAAECATAHEGDRRQRTRLLVLKARHARVSGELPEAVACYRAVVDLDPQHGEAISELRSFHEARRRAAGLQE